MANPGDDWESVIGATLVVFIAVGGVTGWLVGSSSSPVVSAVIPVVGGLLGALNVNFLLRFARQSAALGQNPPPLNAAAQVSRLKSTRSAIVLLAYSTVCFLAAFLVGEYFGICVRSLHTPRFALMVRDHPIQLKDLEPEDQTLVYRFYLALRMLRAEGQDYDDAWDRLLRPLTDQIVTDAAKAKETLKKSDEAKKKDAQNKSSPEPIERNNQNSEKLEKDAQSADTAWNHAREALKKLVEALEAEAKSSGTIAAPAPRGPLGY